jgi:uncharacterized protein
MHGQFVWYELTTPDVDAARRFYPSFTGWGTQQFDKDYTMWTTGGAPFAGIFKLGPEMRQQGVPPNWMPYIESDNVDDTARLATSLGGKVRHGPADIPNVGRFAVIQDPQGAVFGVYKSIRPSQGWDGTPVLGRFSWHELMTTDYQKAFDFYRRLFNWEKTGEPMDMGGGNQYFMYGKANKMYGGMFNRMPDMASMPPFWMIYIHVKDVDKAVDTARKNGGTLHRGPMEIPGGNIAILGDPQGAAFALHDMKQPATAAKPAAKKGSKTAARSPAKSGAKKAATKKRSATKKRTATKKRPAARKATTKRRASAKKAARGKRTAKRRR